MGIETSSDHGGADASFTSAIVVIEELAKIDPSVSVLCDVHNTLVNTIFRKYGTKEQQDKWLPQLATEKLGSFCLSEPASGSDAFALQTKAVKDGNHWIINGSKMYALSLYFESPTNPVSTGGSRTVLKRKSSSSLRTRTSARVTRELRASLPPRIWVYKLRRRN
jgi:Acyl-CoA dehydrogenase, N-terminal domain